MVGRLSLTTVAATLTVAVVVSTTSVPSLRAQQPDSTLSTADFANSSNQALPAAAVAVVPIAAGDPSVTASPALETPEITSPASFDTAATSEPEPIDSTSAVSASATNNFPASPAPTTAGATAGAEFGPEYEISVRNADSFLDRLSARVKGLVEHAMSYLGTPYRRGGSSRKGVDCSGLVGAVYSEQGVEMPRTAAEQFNQGTPIAGSDLLPGDLVFFRDTYKHGISHVGIFIGDGHFIHAAGHHQGVIVSDLGASYYHLRFAGARRMAPASASTATRRASLSEPAAPRLNDPSPLAATAASTPAPTARPAG